MADSVGTLKTVVTASAAGFISTMNAAAGAAEKGGAKIRNAMTGLRSIGSQMGGMFPPEMSGFIDFLSNPKTLGVAGLGAAFGYVQKLGGEVKEIFRGAQRTGMGAVAFQELGWAAKKSGSSIEEASGAVNRMRKAISIGAHGGTSKKVFDQLGLSAKDLSTMEVEQALEKVAKAITKIGSPMERARIEMELFGKSGAQLEPLLNKLASGGLKQFEGKTLNLFQLKSLESSKIAMDQTGVFAKKAAADAVGDMRGVGHMLGSWFRGNFISHDTAKKELSDEATVEENVRKAQDRAMARKQAAAAEAGSLTPSALAPLAMQGSQAAYQAIYGSDVQDKQLDLLAQIAANTSPGGVAQPPSAPVE